MKTFCLFDKGLTKVYLFIVEGSVYTYMYVAPFGVTACTYVYFISEEDPRGIPALLRLLISPTRHESVFERRN